MDKNECPFCYKQFDPTTAERRKLAKIKLRRISHKQVSMIKLMSRMVSDITETDWTLLRNPNYHKLLSVRSNLIDRFSRKVDKIFGRKVHTKKKS